MIYSSRAPCVNYDASADTSIAGDYTCYTV